MACAWRPTSTVPRAGASRCPAGCPGCCRSEGDTDFLLPEAQDGFDTMAWLKGQPWAGPKVGTWGTSWMGWTQTALAGLGPDNLGAMLPNMSGANGYTSS